MPRTAVPGQSRTRTPARPSSRRPLDDQLAQRLRRRGRGRPRRRRRARPCRGPATRPDGDPVAAGGEIGAFGCAQGAQRRPARRSPPMRTTGPRPGSPVCTVRDAGLAQQLLQPLDGVRIGVRGPRRRSPRRRAARPRPPPASTAGAARRRAAPASPSGSVAVAGGGAGVVGGRDRAVRAAEQAADDGDRDGCRSAPPAREPHARLPSVSPVAPVGFEPTTTHSEGVNAGGRCAPFA